MIGNKANTFFETSSSKFKIQVPIDEISDSTSFAENFISEEFSRTASLKSLKL